PLSSHSSSRRRCSLHTTQRGSWSECSLWCFCRTCISVMSFSFSSAESAAVPPEPEKSFDNSTYKNYQHHRYTSYTFADLDVEMTKYRLPQPSSGKLSPRH
uniref:Uncharacterized protein n=1 Tax=Xiphophorus couchianus TaxID=32473 RepID=A0A3B5LVW6_9TELE